MPIKRVRRAAVMAIAFMAVLMVLAGCGQQEHGGTSAANGRLANGQAASVGGSQKSAATPDGQGDTASVLPTATADSQGDGNSAVSAAAADSPDGTVPAVPSASAPDPASSAPSASDFADSSAAGSAASQPSATTSPSGDPDSAAIVSPGQPASSSPSASSRADTPSASPSGNPAAESNQQSSAQADDTGQAKESAITLSVTGNAEWGVVLDPSTVALKSGDTVGDLLIRVLKSHKLAFETRGAGAFFYVTGIDGLFEFDDGPTSGWKYRVNGEVIDRSSGDYKPAPGDRVEWFYASEGEEASGGGKQP